MVPAKKALVEFPSLELPFKKFAGWKILENSVLLEDATCSWHTLSLADALMPASIYLGFLEGWYRTRSRTSELPADKANIHVAASPSICFPRGRRNNWMPYPISEKPEAVCLAH